MDNKKIIELGILPDQEYSGVSAISLVEEPAIEIDFLYFNKEEFVHPNAGESHDDFINRCMPVVVGEGNEQDQAYAICQSYWDGKFEALKVSVDFDDTANTARGLDLVKRLLADGDTVYIISARNDESGIQEWVTKNQLNIQGVYATGSNKAKVEKIKELGIEKHYDNNADVIAELGTIGEQFDIQVDAPAYVDPGVKKKRIEEVFNEVEIETILELANVLGVKGDDVETVDFNFATEDKNIINVYRYEGGLHTNSRNFCRSLVSSNRFYTKDEIEGMDTLNTEFGPGVGGGQYSIFKYKGGANCGHAWQKYSAFYNEKGKLTIIGQEVPSSKEERTAAVEPRTTRGRGYVKRPQRNLAPLAAFQAFQSEEQQILVAPCMVPDMEIPRRAEDGSVYWVKFSPETIKEIAMKYMKEARTNSTNEDHDSEQPAGAYVFESWIVENPETDKAKTVYGFDVPKGSWMVSMKVEDKETWKRIKNGELKGFSVEGSFADMEEIQAQKDYNKIIKILRNN